MVEDISKGDYGVFYSKTLGEFFDVSVRENRVVLASPFTCRTEKSFSVSEFMSVIIGVNEFTAVSKDVENIMYEGVSSLTFFSPSRSKPFHVNPRCFFNSFSRSYCLSSNSMRIATRRNSTY